MAAGTCYVNTQKHCDWHQWPEELSTGVENGFRFCLEGTMFPGHKETVCLMGHYRLWNSLSILQP